MKDTSDPHPTPAKTRFSVLSPIEPFSKLFEVFQSSWFLGAQDILKLMDDMQELKPTLFASVPRLYNRIYDRSVFPVPSHHPITGEQPRKNCIIDINRQVTCGCKMVLHSAGCVTPLFGLLRNIKAASL